MRKTGLVMAVVLGVSVFVVGQAASGTKQVELKDSKGQSVGTARIKPAEKGVVVELELRNLPPGEHAVHFHEAAKCEAPAFTSAGAHFNPAARKHGLENSEGHHNGDMPNITVADDGTAKATLRNADVTLGPGSNSVYANGGTSLMIHEKADDMKSDPAGNAGGRIACGVVTP